MIILQKKEELRRNKYFLKSIDNTLNYVREYLESLKEKVLIPTTSLGALAMFPPICYVNFEQTFKMSQKRKKIRKCQLRVYEF